MLLLLLSCIIVVIVVIFVVMMFVIIVITVSIVIIVIIVVMIIVIISVIIVIIVNAQVPMTDAAADVNLELFRKTFRKNALMLSGVVATKVLQRQSVLLSNKNAFEWRQLRLLPPEQYEESLLVVCMAGDSFYRLVFPNDAPRVRIWDVCHVNGILNQDWNRINAIANDLRAKRQVCRACVDLDFTDQFIDPLLDLAGRQEAHDVLCHSVLVVRSSGASVERSHLAGEELKGPKVRGRAFAPTAVSLKTYQAFARQDHGATKAAMEDALLGMRGFTRPQLAHWTQAPQLTKGDGNVSNVAKKQVGAGLQFGS